MTPTNPVAGTDPRVLLQQLFQQINDNSVNYYELLAADSIAGIVSAWRVVYRWLAVDVASNQWGTPNWGLYGDLSSQEGTTSLQEVMFFMARSNAGNSSGKFEVQLEVGDQWYSAASLLKGLPLVQNVVPGVPQIYMPGPPLSIFSFNVYATTPQAPAYAPVQSNPGNPIGTLVPGFLNGYHNVGGPYWSTNGMKDPSGQYTLENPSPMYSDWSKMIWVKTA